jgi:ATP-dependent helicase HrpB
VIFATNIAETSLTVPGVSTVIDTGLQKVARYDAERAIDALVAERVSTDSADQRAGRAARLGPGRSRRLWDSRDRLRPSREPEIHRVDLAGTVLGLIAAGNRPEHFPWFDSPAADRLEAAFGLLERLGAIHTGSITPLGQQLRRLPLHPRLARVLLDCDGAWMAAQACALLSEGRGSNRAPGSTSCDLLPLIDRWSDVPPHTRQVADTLHRLAGGNVGKGADTDETALRKALFAAYPDRVARRRAADRSRVVLSSGRGALMARESGVTDGEWLVALEVTSGRAGQLDALVRLASRVEPEWVTPTSTTVEHRLHGDAVRAAEVDWYEALAIRERPVPADPAARSELLAAAWRAGPHDEATIQLLRRARFAALDLDVDALSLAAAANAQRVGDIDIASVLSRDAARRLETTAPLQLPVPSGRSARLTYNEDGTVTAAVKLQELFGLADTPRLGPNQEPVIFELLAPNGRPVQTTRDLRSFWTRTYPEVRKELRGRYPKHPWPEDPWSATLTHKTKRR